MIVLFVSVIVVLVIMACIFSWLESKRYIYLGTYWGLVSLVSLYGDREISGTERKERVCFKIMYDKKLMEYHVKYPITDKRGDIIDGYESADYRLRKLRICLGNDKINVDEYLKNLKDSKGI